MNSAAIHCDKICKEFEKSLLLLRSAVVLRPSLVIDTANVGNANAVGVVTIAMGARLRNSATSLNSTITFNYVVIPDASEPSFFVDPIDVGCTQFRTRAICGAVDNNIIDYSHGCMEA